MTVYISEIKFKNVDDFVEVVATAGEDLSGYSLAVYDHKGDLQSTHSLAGEHETTVGQHEAYLVDGADGLPNMGPNWGVALIDDQGQVLQFLSGNGKVITADDGPAAGETSTATPKTTGQESVETTDGGATYVAQDAPNPGTIPCFATGTLIDTPVGPRAVERLRPGDPVDTLDGGAMPVRWVRQSTHWLDGPGKAGLPILIRAGALGPGRPARDLVVSPQHRVLVGGGRQVVSAFGGECFAPAKSLTGLPGIREMRGRTRVTWVHFALATHQVVISNGALTESLLLGPMVVQGLTAGQRCELDALFGPRGPDGWNGPPARPCRKVREVRAILERWRGARRQAA